MNSDAWRRIRLFLLVGTGLVFLGCSKAPVSPTGPKVVDRSAERTTPDSSTETPAPNESAPPASSAPKEAAVSASPKEAPDYEGFLDGLTPLGIAGWAWDKKRPDAAVTVDILEGDKLLGSVTANRFRDDVKKGGIGTGMYGFAFAVPESLKDGKPHIISAKIAGTNIDLQESPKSLTYSPAFERQPSKKP
jgi:hypothetical protein